MRRRLRSGHENTRQRTNAVPSPRGKGQVEIWRKSLSIENAEASALLMSDSMNSGERSGNHKNSIKPVRVCPGGIECHHYRIGCRDLAIQVVPDVLVQIGFV